MSECVLNEFMRTRGTVESHCSFRSFGSNYLVRITIAQSCKLLEHKQTSTCRTARSRNVMSSRTVMALFGLQTSRWGKARLHERINKRFVPFAAHRRSQSSVELQDCQLIRGFCMPLVVSGQIGVLDNLFGKIQSQVERCSPHPTQQSGCPAGNQRCCSPCRQVVGSTCSSRFYKPLP